MQNEVMAIMAEKMMERIIPFMNVMFKYFEEKGHEDPMATVRYFLASIDGVQMHIITDSTFPVESVKKQIIKQFIH